jgi:hypothetical protein
MSINISLKNVSVNGDWIEGDIELHVDQLGIQFSKTQHFKTKKDLDQDIDLGGGYTLHVKLTLEPPNNVCIAGRFSKDMIGIDIPKQCFSL